MFINNTKWKLNTHEISSIENIIKKLQKNNDYNNIYPEEHNVFRCLELCDPDKVRVVILAEEPYTGRCTCLQHCRATGVAFSQRVCDSKSSIVSNIHQELQNCYPNFVIPKHGNLEKWCEQGVLLLNCCFTCQPNVSKSHDILWMGIIKNIISILDEVNPKTIFLLWGREMEKMEFYLPNSMVKIKGPHPNTSKFLKNKHFLQVNEILKSREENPIDWSL